MVNDSEWVIAEEMAKEAGISHKRFREELRKDLQTHWHDRYAQWRIQHDSLQRREMLRVLNRHTYCNLPAAHRATGSFTNYENAHSERNRRNRE